MNDKDILDHQRDRHQLMNNLNKNQEFEVVLMFCFTLAGFIMAIIGVIALIVTIINPNWSPAIASVVAVSSSAVLVWYASHIKKRLVYESRSKSRIQKT